jgi:hypothetical protein
VCECASGAPEVQLSFSHEPRHVILVSPARSVCTYSTVLYCISHQVLRTSVLAFRRYCLSVSAVLLYVPYRTYGTRARSDVPRQYRTHGPTPARNALSRREVPRWLPP